MLPEVWGEDEEQLVSWDSEVRLAPAVPVPSPACQHQYQLARRSKTTNMATMVGRETSKPMAKVTTKDNNVGGQSFYKKSDLVKNVGTVAIRTLPTVKRAPVIVGNSFQELQIPEVAMFGASAFQRLQVPEVAMFGESAFQKLQAPEMSMFGDSACGADPEVMPSGVRPVEQVLKRPSGIRPVEQALKSYDDFALSSGDEGIDDFGFETYAANPPTRTSIPQRSHQPPRP